MIKRILLLALIVGLSGLWACAGRSTTAQDRDAGVPTADEYISDYDELQTLYQELLTLKDDPGFASRALAPGTPSATWMERTRQAHGRAGSLTAFTEGTRVLLLLGVMYKQAGGQENDLTTSMRQKLESTLETLKIRKADVFQIVCSGQTNGQVQAIRGCCSFDGGLSARVHYFEKELGGKTPRTLLLDNGNAFAHRGDQAEIQNDLVVRVMNAMGYDAMGLGPLDVSLGSETLRRILAEANFPVVATNLHVDEGQPWFLPWILLESDGIKVAILSVQPVQTLAPGLNLEDPETALARTFSEVTDKSDLIVLLSQCPGDTNRRIMKSFPQINVLVTNTKSFGKTNDDFVELTTERRGGRIGLLRFVQHQRQDMTVLDRKSVALAMANAYFDPATQEMIDKALGVAE